jgi:hypothetical protein
VIVKLDVLERPEKKAELENPGAEALRVEYGGERSGVPFFVFLNDQGKKLADSNALPGGQNIGYPAKPEEITAFQKLLKQTAPRLTDAQLSPLITYLQKPVSH